MKELILAHYSPAGADEVGSFMAYLFALHSLSAFAVAGLWIRVWLAPKSGRVSLAALATAILLAISGFRLASAIVLRSGV